MLCVLPGEKRFKGIGLLKHENGIGGQTTLRDCPPHGKWVSLRYYITDRQALGGIQPLVANISAAIGSGVDWLQIREKDLPARALAALVKEVLRIPNPSHTRILVNDRADIALACGAHGVHLRSNSMPPAVLRKIAPKDFVIGVSCHSVEEVIAAARDQADFAVLAPIFATPHKGPPLGLRALAQAAHAVAIPVLALGGVGPAQIPACLRAGAAGIAGIRLFQSGGLGKYPDNSGKVS
jgi:thiamine-phosphate pyrophosphorylase